MPKPRKPRLLIISWVKPYDCKSGQQARVYNKIVALQSRFQITFLTVDRKSKLPRAKDELARIVDRAIVLPSVSQRNLASRMWYKFLGVLYSLATGLKSSNYVLGSVELSPRRISTHCAADSYDLVLFEYWHTHQSVQMFRQRDIPCVLDMHDVLWQSYEQQLATRRFGVRLLRHHLVRAYRRREEAAWDKYDALIAISSGEAAYAQTVVPGKPIFLAPMGTDLAKWPYCWSPARPLRLAFYGAMSNPNLRSIVRCVERIMPLIWQSAPETEFWIVGGTPPPKIVALGRNPRVRVTGYVEDVGELLASMTAVLCPWEGTYGFRSRLIEVMAVGTPVVATPDAVYGMGLTVDKGLLLGHDDETLARHCRVLLERADLALEQSKLARRQVEENFSFDATYGKLADELYRFARPGQL